MKKFIALLVTGLLVLSLAGCAKGGENASDSEAKTLATTLKNEFVKLSKESGATVESIATKLAESDLLMDQNIVTMPVEEGYLNGFDSEIAGFNEGMMFSPMIGSIPFVGYIFSADDTAALEKILSEHGQLNWNICTVADEMVVDSNNGFVFFVMAPLSFDENN